MLSPVTCSYLNIWQWMSSGVTAACDSTVTVLLLSPLLTPSFRSKFQASFLCLKLKFQQRETRVSRLETNGFKLMELKFHPMKPMVWRYETNVFLWLKNMKLYRLWFSGKRKGREERTVGEKVTAKVLSLCCHMLPSHHYLFIVRSLNTNMWQMTAIFHFLIL